MIKFLKHLFGGQINEELEEKSTGRTFNKILTGKHFGGEDSETDESQIDKAKQDKVDQIARGGFKPMFLRYDYDDVNSKTPQIYSAYVVFQEERFSKKGQMIHISEISFIVNRVDFEELEERLNINLIDDFRDLTSYKNSLPFTGKERRSKVREK